MRVVVIGASGLLGYTLFRGWGARPGWEVRGFDLRAPDPSVGRLDLLDAQSCRRLIAEYGPDCVVVTASNPHVDYCEAHPEETRRLNVDATIEAAKSASDAGSRFIFFSSDYVFDGRKGAYSEDDAPHPLNEYGRQKLSVERFLSGLGERALTVRISGLFGWELYPRNFALQVLSRLKDGRAVRAADDQSYNPTYAVSLSEALAGLVEKGSSGLFHLAGPDAVSRAEFSRRVAEAFGFEGVGIEACSVRKLLTASSAPRPQRSSLVSVKAAEVLGASLWDLEKSLSHLREAEAEWTALTKALPASA